MQPDERTNDALWSIERAVIDLRNNLQIDVRDLRDAAHRIADLTGDLAGELEQLNAQLSNVLERMGFTGTSRGSRQP